MAASLDRKRLYESDRFHAENYYSGPLGCVYAPAGTSFYLWAPTAEAVQLRLFLKGDGGRCLDQHPMHRQAHGVWTAFLPGNRAGLYYTYAVTVDGHTEEIVDPYARSGGVNGRRGMILDLRTTDPAGWQQDSRPLIPAEQRVIWEVSVRDFSASPSSGIRLSMRGKFLAFTQENTTLSFDGVNPTCLAYLKRLGVTHVQLLPIYDSGSVNEARPLENQYNWGYDPVNYNMPEGSYSTDPFRGEVRVRELKQAVMALHKAGIGVVMDVVYNHMWHWDNCLNGAVPNYFFRQNEDGSPSNGSGCGNEVASERPMARRFIIDSLVYWATEYHLDGFRFDLMGLLDVDTMNAARAALDALPDGNRILMYGEPWQGGGSAITAPAADKGNLHLLSERIGVFCDNTRDAIKGSCFHAADPGYVTGKADACWDIGAGVAAWCRSDHLPPHAPSQIVSYVSAHDNFTLWDKLLLTNGHPKTKADYTGSPADEATQKALAQNRLCAAIYLTCMGMPFMQAGEEFARTKYGEGNSYNSPLAVNQLDWQRAAAYHPLVDYYRGLIGLRKAFPALGAQDRTAAESIVFSPLPEQPLVGWMMPARPGDNTPWQALCVFYNPTEARHTAQLPAGVWRLLCSGESSSLWCGAELLCSDTVALPPCCAVILGQVG